MKGILVAAPGTGAGKTTVSAALMAALRKRGLKVQPFKCGPDFIDPGHQALICGRSAHNLDSWMLSAEANCRIFASACHDADFAIVEGMMGLFDGVSGNSEQGSSAEIAKLLGLPILLVVDASSAARSVAALVHGFKSFDPQTRMIGVVLNRVAGSAHAEMLLDAMRAVDSGLIVGWIPDHEEVRLKERYLGLQTAEERSWTTGALDRMAGLVESNLPIERLLEVAEISLPAAIAPVDAAVHDAPVRIGVARDRAFCFYYQAGLDELCRQGAEIVEFSPLKVAHLPADLDALYFGGGYPELYTEQLSNHTTLLSELRDFADAGKPIYGECGGLILLARELITKDGARWPMAGLLPLSIQMTDELVHFGYAEVDFLEDSLAKKGTRLRGHSFHCSKIADQGQTRKTTLVRYSISQRSEQEGFSVGSVFASYVHLHFAAQAEVATRFVALARLSRSRCSVAP